VQDKLAASQIKKKPTPQQNPDKWKRCIKHQYTDKRLTDGKPPCCKILTPVSRLTGHRRSTLHARSPRDLEGRRATGCSPEGKTFHRNLDCLAACGTLDTLELIQDVRYWKLLKTLRYAPSYRSSVKKNNTHHTEFIQASAVQSSAFSAILKEKIARYGINRVLQNLKL